ncbi:MAG: DUF1207 domain-containing protein [Pseudomonadota bacterium]
MAGIEILIRDRRWRIGWLLISFCLFLAVNGRAEAGGEIAVPSTSAGAVNLVSGPAAAEPAPQDWRLEFFPDRGRAFQPLEADPREARFRLGFMTNKGDVYEDLGLGGDLGLLWAGLPDGGEITLTARGLFTARFDVFSESFDLRNTDFIGGAAAGWSGENNSLELFVYHQSSHLGDEILERGEQKRIDYSRETARFLWSYSRDIFRFYAGPAYTFHGWPEKIRDKLDLQAGGACRFSLWKLNLFVAGDAQALGAHDFFVNTTGQAGVYLGATDKTSNRQWIFFEIFQGHSAMGQFFDQWESYQMIGVGYQFR